MQEILKNTEDAMKRGLEYFQTELDGVQAGRANTSLIEGVKVDAYGQEMTMKQVGLFPLRMPARSRCKYGISRSLAP